MTTAVVRVKFSSQAAREVLAALRQLALSQGRQFQAVLDDALRDYIDRQQKERPLHPVLRSLTASTANWPGKRSWPGAIASPWPMYSECTQR